MGVKYAGVVLRRKEEPQAVCGKTTGEGGGMK